MARADLFIEISNRESVQGVANLAQAALPGFVQGDTLTLRIYLVQYTGPTSDPERITTAGRTLEIALGKKVGTGKQLYTQQFTWTASSDLADPYWEADLPMNTAAISTLLGSKDKASAFLEVKLFEDGAPRTVLSKPVSIEACVIEDGGTTEPAEGTPLSAEVAAATFIPRSPYQGTIRLVSPDGTKQAELYIDNDGTCHFDPVS